MATILVNNKYCKIDGEKDWSFLKSLDKHLSFKVAGAEYTPAFRGTYGPDGKFYKWDGIKRILTNKLVFPSGLLERVIDFYKENGREVQVLNISKPKSVGIPLNITDKLKSIGKEPYDYQLQVLDKIKQYDRGIIRAATGAGKSLIAALMTAHFGKSTILYVIGKDLLYQFYQLFVEIFGEDQVGIIGDGQCKIAKFNIASIWTVGQALGIKKKDILLDNDEDEKVDKTKYADILKMLKEVKVHLLDECHICACDTIQKIYKYSNPEHIYGLSGTPWRDDNQDLMIEAILGKYIMDIPASILINRKFLAKPVIRFVKVAPLLDPEGRTYQSVYQNYIVENMQRNGLILKYAIKLKEKGYQTLVLFNTIKHGDILYKLISPHLKCALLSGKDDSQTRDEIKQKLLNKEIDVVIASRIYDIGVDVPSLSGLILASGGKSTVKALQRVGRVIRKYPGKNQVAIVDFFDDAKYLRNHSKIRYKIYSSEPGFEVHWIKDER